MASLTRMSGGRLAGRDADGRAELDSIARAVLAVAEHDHDVDLAADDRLRLVDEALLVLGGEGHLGLDGEAA